MTREERQEKDLCRTCEHHWLDFPLPLNGFIAHCEILDRKPGNNNMDEIVPYPCLECPFDSYHRKVDTKMRTCDKLEMEKLYGEEY